MKVADLICTSPVLELSRGQYELLEEIQQNRKETVEHLECPRFCEQRPELREKAGNLKLEALLGDGER